MQEDLSQLPQRLRKRSQLHQPRPGVPGMCSMGSALMGASMGAGSQAGPSHSYSTGVVENHMGRTSMVENQLGRTGMVGNQLGCTGVVRNQLERTRAVQGFEPTGSPPPRGSANTSTGVQGRQRCASARSPAISPPHGTDAATTSSMYTTGSTTNPGSPTTHKSLGVCTSPPPLRGCVGAHPASMTEPVQAPQHEHEGLVPQLSPFALSSELSPPSELSPFQGSTVLTDDGRGKGLMLPVAAVHHLRQLLSQV